MRFHRHAFLVLAGAAALCGCPAKEQAPADERLLEKLKAEQEKLAHGAPAGHPPGPPQAAPAGPNADLARLAAAAGSDEGSRRLPPGNSTVHLGTVAVKLAGLSTSHSVSGAGQVSLTTADLFLKVSLVAENVGPAPMRLDLSFTRVSAAGTDYALARDAQRAGGTRELQRDFPILERADLVLFFEVPQEAFGSGLKLVFPAAIAGARDLEVPLE